MDMRSRQKSTFAVDDSGTALTEFLLVFPMLVLMIFGVLWFGMLFMTWSSMHNATRETARHWAVGDFTTVASAHADVIARLAVVRWVPAANWDVSGTVKSGNQLTVSVTVPTNLVSPFPLPWVPLPATIETTVVIREE